ncbi:hypothetical protein SAMN02927921_03850 [Sinomicrobium oceani]|uniref:Uncharacterized protein n=1 Tax=Sinomicrobium oceani TaxID=1150368 RepID=A0A1K1RPJ7_9FLAO|nr:hypothetical protein SAMN02927921_03850 [Sinomicrobium oceani]
MFNFDFIRMKINGIGKPKEPGINALNDYIEIWKKVSYSK